MEMLTILLMLIVPDNFYWMVTVLIKCWIVWISLSLLLRLLLRRVDNTRMERYL